MTTEKFNLILKDYPEEIKLSDKRRALHIHQSEGEGIPKHIRKNIGEAEDKDYYFDVHGWVVNRKTAEKVIRNKRTAGKAHYKKINGQGIWDGSISSYQRNDLKIFLREYFVPNIKRNLPEKIFTTIALFIHFEFIFYKDLTQLHIQDIDNHAYPYVKAFLDAMVTTQVIPDDKGKYVRGVSSRYVHIPNNEERRLEIKIHFCQNNQRIC